MTADNNDEISRRNNDAIKFANGITTGVILNSIYIWANRNKYTVIKQILLVLFIWYVLFGFTVHFFVIEWIRTKPISQRKSETY